MTKLHSNHTGTSQIYLAWLIPNHSWITFRRNGNEGEKE